jgi:hypothetical protein
VPPGLSRRGERFRLQPLTDPRAMSYVSRTSFDHAE